MTHLVLAHTIDDVRARVRDRRAETADARVVLVPTMGALHAGHRSLIERATQHGTVVVVSIFVNPLQFGDQADLTAYPRTLDEDVEQLRELGVDVVFAPSPDEMYPAGPPATRVSGGDLAGRFEGRTRRGHFDGVLTVVAKLFNIVQPDAAVFGKKDAQQLFLVQRMVRDLDLPIEIVAADTVRESDGVALSSRNRRLDARERSAATVLYRALDAAASAADGGVDSSIAAAQSALMGEPLVTLDYLAVVDPATFSPVDDGFRGAATVLIAATVGGTRLIDNETAYYR